MQKEVNNRKENKAVGRTFWDILHSIVSKKPVPVFLLFAILLTVALFLILTGLLRFEINNGKLSMGFNSNRGSQTTQIINKSPDELLEFCVKKGTELNLKYVIKSITQIVELKLIGPSKKTLLVKERIVYDILALHDVTTTESTFYEENVSQGALKVIRWYGTDREINSDIGNDTKYQIPFNCKKGESKTIITGADYYYSLPLESNRSTSFKDYLLMQNEDLYFYPNEYDVIGKLKMIISSEDIKFKEIPNAAFHSISGKTIFYSDAFYNFDAEAKNACNSVSAEWKTILPDESFALHVVW
jgi:hypothetical protein